MKFIVGTVGLLLLFACDQKNSLPQSLCECFDVQLAMMEEIEGKEMDDELLEEVEQKYEAEFNACDILAQEFEEDIKDLPQEKQVEAQQELMSSCEAYQEYAKQNEAMIQQQMQGQENPFEGMSEEEILEYLQESADAELEQLEEK